MAYEGPMQKNLYVGAQHYPTLQRVLEHLEQLHGPRSGEFSNWMWEAAIMRLASEGAKLTPQERRLIEEIQRTIRTTIEEALSGGQLVKPQYPDDPGISIDDSGLDSLFGGGKANFGG